MCQGYLYHYHCQRERERERERVKLRAMAGPQCCVPAPPCSSVHILSITGKEESFADLQSYVSSPSQPPKAAVLVITDVFGHQVPGLRKMVDKIAAAGFFVVAPDFFDGDAFSPGGLPISEWLKKHGPVEAAEVAGKVVEALKSQGFSSIGAIGCCWGAKVAVELAKKGVINAAVLCHPSFVTKDDIKAIKKPLAILAAEIDTISPPSLINEFLKILESNEEVPFFVNVYPEVAHGWTVRYDFNDEKAVKCANEAHDKALEWLGTHLC